MSFILESKNAYSPVNTTDFFLKREEEIDDLITRIQNIVRKESSSYSDYWKFCCCFCPKIMKSRVSNVSDALKRELIEAFKNSLNSHVYRESPLGISLNNGDGLLIDCNDTYLNLIGYSKEEIVNQHFTKQIHETDFANAKRKIIELNNGTIVEQCEIRVKRKDETYFWCQLTVSKVLDLQKKPRYLITQISDISELKEAQRNLEQKVEERTKELEKLTQDLQELEYFVRRLMATNNHELRTAVGGINGYSKILHEDRDTLTLTEQNDLLLTIGSSSEHLLKLLNDNLDFSKIREGILPLILEEFSILELLEDIHASNSIKLDKSKVDLSWSIAESFPTILVGDATRIRQIVENLLSNAIKFTERGRISIEVSWEHIDPKLKEIMLNFKITNDGEAIPPAMRDTLFKPYQQGQHPKGGTGLGLVIAKGLVEAMGGKMFPVISPVNDKGGTTFSFCIKISPLMDSLGEARTSEISQSNRLTQAKTRLIGKKILIVEDVIMNQKIIERLLSNAGLICTVVGNGLLAVQKLRENSDFDLVLMDIQMPVMDGLQATLEIRDTLHLTTLPIIGLTANGNSYEKICKDVGMNAYSGKPYNEIQLFLKMEELIFGDQPIRTDKRRKSSGDSFSTNADSFI